jgi:hypothetical protein
MRLTLVLLATISLFVSIVQAKDISRQNIQKAMKNIGPHPRLLWPAGTEKEMKARTESDPIAKALYDDIRGQSDLLLTVEPIEQVKIGKRLLDKSRKCLKRVTYLSFMYRMTGQKPYLDRAEKEMLTAAGFSDWNPSHYLDTGEMTAALAIGYDWLYADLSQETRDKIRKALVEKGIQPSFEKNGSNWWVNAPMNWNQVCNGGLTLGALAIAQEEPTLAEDVIRRAVNGVQKAMNVYLPDGAYPEGPGYWGYGTVYNVLMLSAMDTAMGTDFELSRHPGFAKTGDYYLQMTGPTGYFFNYADCGRRGGVNESIFWLAAHYNQPRVIWNETASLRQYKPFLLKNDAAEQGRAFLPMLLIWSKSFAQPATPKTLCWFGQGENPVAVLRGGWEAEATYLAIKGGTPRASHGHMDVGSFVLDAGGIRWAIDLGSQDYNRLEQMRVRLFDMKQDSDRWKIFRYTNHWHNTLIVDDKLQQVAGFAPMIQFSDQKPAPQAVFDLSDVYQGQLQKAVRGVTLDGQNVRVQDQWKAGGKETVVRWSMVTPADVQIDSANKAILKKDNKTLAFEVTCPKETKIATWSTEPRSDWDEPNPGTRIIGFEVTMAADEEIRVTVTMTPGK